MAAVVRVKRRCDEEPLDNLILNVKRRKTENNAESSDELPKVLKFAGTIENQEDIYKHILKPSKAKVEEEFKKHLVDINGKLREEIQTNSKNNRFKVVNLHRSKSSNTDSSDGSGKGDIAIVDVEVDESKENIDKPPDKDSQHVYDLYYTNSDDFEIDVHELISVYPLSDGLVFEDNTENNYFGNDSDDSEDSNAENNWRNDYPDEYDIDSITDEHMLESMNRIDLNGDNELSSDDGEEGFVYSIDSEAAGFEEDIDPSDVRRYGEMYARFKAGCKKLVEEKSVNYDELDIDEDEDYY